MDSSSLIKTISRQMFNLARRVFGHETGIHEDEQVWSFATVYVRAIVAVEAWKFSGMWEAPQGFLPPPDR